MARQKNLVFLAPLSISSFRAQLFSPCFFVLTLTFLIAQGCSPRIEDFPSLVNEGILSLSPSNPYQGANAFISRELEKSEQLRGFFRTRGAPDAIQLLEPRFQRPELYLYYPEEQIVYKGELQQSKTVHEWVVLGPYGISRQDYLVLRRLARAVKGDPVFVVFGKRIRFPVQRELTVARKIEPVIPLPPTPTPTPVPVPVVPEIGEGAEKEEEKTSEFANPAFVPRGLDEQALMKAQGYARKDLNGDILHVVKSTREKIEELSVWYTGSAENAGQIREINQLLSKDPLEIGQVIRIPLEFIVETKQYQSNRVPELLPAPSLEELEAILE